MNCWIIITEDGPIGGLVQAARALGGTVTAAVVGPRELAESVAAHGPDAVAWYETTEGVPAEAHARQLAQDCAAANPRVALCLPSAAGRALLGAIAKKLGAVTLNSVPALAVDGDHVLVTRSVVEGRGIETLEVTGPLAGIFDGEDVHAEAANAPIEAAKASPDEDVRVVEVKQGSGEAAGLKEAARVVGIGRGVRGRDDLAMVEDLAAALNAEIACTLPLCDDKRWFDESRVLGTSTQQIAPDLYIAAGLSGQPQHMSGVRGAKVVVGINNDAEASIFKKSNYGIVGDLYEVLPALTQALRGN